MIRIQDDRFKKQAMGGGLSLDRAAVVVIGIDLRGLDPETPRGGSPGIRCDIAYGREDGAGQFQPFHYDSLEHTVPFYVEPHQFQNYRSSAVAEMARLRGGGAGIPAGPVGAGLKPAPTSLLEALVLWFEAELVAQGKMGEGATVA